MSSPSLPDGSFDIHLDPVGGIAGDMFVAAMIDALPALEPRVLDALAAVRPDGAQTPRLVETSSAGMRARRFGLPVSKGGYRTATDAHSGTSYVELARSIERAPLDERTRMHALALLALLGEAEAHVHGKPLEQVHFHELADWDSLMDVVAAGCIAGALAQARWTIGPLPLGGGRVRTAHGMLPVPAPATSALLAGYPWRDDGIDGERVTPTGAAIVRHLVAPGNATSRCRGGTLRSAGAGAGTRSLGDTPNILRVLVFERTARDEAIDDDSILTVEFDVDDMTGEEIALAADRLRAHEGVLDVSFGTRTGKKGRPMADFRILADPASRASLVHACFGETSTLGVRVRDDRRQILRRNEVRAGDVSVKVAQRPGGVRTGKAAHDDVAGNATLEARRIARAAAEQQALDDDE